MDVAGELRGENERLPWGKKAEHERQYRCRRLQDQIPLSEPKGRFFKKLSRVSGHPSSLFWNSAGIWIPVGVPS